MIALGGTFEARESYDQTKSWSICILHSQGENALTQQAGFSQRSIERRGPHDDVRSCGRGACRCAVGRDSPRWHRDGSAVPAYSVPDAAAFSLARSLRALSAGRGVRVTGRPDRPRGHGYAPRHRNTEGFSAVRRKSHVRRSGERGERTSSPDPVSEFMAKSWRRGGTKAPEPEYAVLAEAEPVRSYPKGETRCDFGTADSTWTTQTHDESQRR